MRVHEITQITEGINDPYLFKAIFLAGPPGAGKNYVIKELGISAAGLKLMDIDHTLHYLTIAKKTNEKITAITDADYDRVRKVHIARMSLLQQGMLGLIINTTGREPEKINELKKSLESTGYSTFMIFVGVDKHIAQSRIKNRELFATDPQDKRNVTDDYFHAAYNASTNASSYYSMLFGENFAYIENNVPVTEDCVDEDANSDFIADVKQVSKKVMRFLQEPLSHTAQRIVDAAKKLRNLS